MNKRYDPFIFNLQDKPFFFFLRKKQQKKKSYKKNRSQHHVIDSDNILQMRNTNDLHYKKFV